MFRKSRKEATYYFFRPRYTALSEVVESWPGFERFGAKLRSIRSAMPEKVLQLNDRSNAKMAVLNHGDFWLNNMMFKYSDTGEVEDIKFVDFQFARFASPAVDLHYFLVTSPNDEVREEGLDTLLEVYHSELCRVLEALGCGDKIVTLDWLKQEMKDKMFYALHVACANLNLVVSDHEHVVDSSETKDGPDIEGKLTQMHRSYNSSRYKRLFSQFLLTFEKEGLL